MSDNTATEWGVLITLPNGTTDVEEADGRGYALMAADSVERRVPGSAARLVYRTVNYGDWTTDLGSGPGWQWAYRETWPDGHVEIHVRDSRAKAEFGAGAKQGADRVVVARTRQVGDWWLAEVTA